MAQFAQKSLYECKTNRWTKLYQGRQTFMFTNLISHDRTPAYRDDSTMPFGPRRGGFIDAADRVFEEGWPLDEATVEQCEAFDLVYRTLCAVLYNYVPLSGHPGGSISGRALRCPVVVRCNGL